MTDPRGAAVLRRLELTVNRRLDGLLQGDYRGLVPGHGTEPGETRGYQPGDDVRRIDWNVTARTGELHVRDAIADRELECWLVVDQSASLDFGTAGCEKRDLALEMAAAVGFLTARGGNRIGALLLRGSESVTVPARSGRRHLYSILARVQDAPRDSAGAPLAAGLDRIGAIARRRGLVVVISDFLTSAAEIDGGPGDAASWSHALRRLNLRHDVIAVEVLDPRELELPSVGVLTLVDPETGRQREVRTTDRRLRERYAAAASAQRLGIAAAIRASGAAHLELRTDRDWLRDLVRFVGLRRRLVAGVPAAAVVATP